MPGGRLGNFLRRVGYRLTMNWHGLLPALTGREVWVAGYGSAGKSVINALQRLGAVVVLIDESDIEAPADIRTLKEVPAEITASLVVTSPGWRPTHELFKAAARAEVEVIGDVELAWRVDQALAERKQGFAPRWLAITGTNGKTTTVEMLECMLNAGGVRAVACGNVGLPVIDAVMSDEGYDALAVELSSFEIHWAKSLKPFAAVLLNISDDHLDWHGSLAAYAQTKVALLVQSEYAVFNADDENTAAALASHPTGEWFSFTLGAPRPGQVGVVEDLLVDRAFVGNPDIEAVALATLSDVKPFAPHNVANALAAASLARAAGVAPDRITEGLLEFKPGGHRIALVATVAEVDYVDDSKATNPHAAGASLRAFPSVVWIAGGLAKGASMDQLVLESARRLRAAILIGTDKELIRKALETHAPQVPVVSIDVPDSDLSKRASAKILMERVIRAAAGFAQPRDTVLLAPACASMDQFESYAERGDLFADAVDLLVRGELP